VLRSRINSYAPVRPLKTQPLIYLDCEFDTCAHTNYLIYFVKELCESLRSKPAIITTFWKLKQ